MIVIHAAGNESIGIGNLIRCYSLAFTLNKSYGEEIKIIFECSDEVEKVINTDLLTIIKVEQRIDAVRYINSLNITDKNNIYITDLIDIEIGFESLIRARGFNTLIHLNDSSLDVYKPDVIIDGDGFNKTWNIEGVDILQSPKYHILKRELIGKKPISAWNGENVKNILVCFGGSDPANYTELLLEQLSCNNENYIDDFEINIVIGPGFTEERTKKLLSRKKDNVNYYRNVTDMCKLLSENDLIVTLGGGVTYEAMYMGKPTVAVKWEYMSYYVEKLSEANLIKSISKDKIVECILDLSKDIEGLKKMAFEGWQIIDGEANDRIGKYIDQIYKGN